MKSSGVVEEGTSHKTLTKEEGETWTKILEANRLFFHASKVATCNQKLLFIETCSNDLNHYKKPIYEHCFDRAYCKDCAAATAKKNALITYNWILENIAKNLDFNLYVLRFDLTLPHEFDEISEEKVRTIVSRFMLELRGNEEGYDPEEEIGWLYVIHRFGSNGNIFNRHLNIHIYALNAILKGGHFRRSRPWANEERAKGIWGYILQEELGWSEYVEKNPDLRVRYIPFFKKNDKAGRPLSQPYATMIGKHLLTLRYMYRYPVIDVHKVFQKNAQSILDLSNKGVPGQSPVYVQSTSAVGLKDVLESHHKVVWMGYLANSKKEATLKLLTNRPIPLSQIIRNLPRKTCPKCNSPLIPCWEEHTEAEQEAEYVEENDWGELEKDLTDSSFSKEESEEDFERWTLRVAYDRQRSRQAYLARVNGW